jgi:hypothetical protein
MMQQRALFAAVTAAATARDDLSRRSMELGRTECRTTEAGLLPKDVGTVITICKAHH